MELYQLQYFIEVARNRNFTRAAKRLDLATPALSLQIQKLEKNSAGHITVKPLEKGATLLANE